MSYLLLPKIISAVISAIGRYHTSPTSQRTLCHMCNCASLPYRPAPPSTQHRHQSGWRRQRPSVYVGSMNPSRWTCARTGCISNEARGFGALVLTVSCRSETSTYKIGMSKLRGRYSARSQNGYTTLTRVFVQKSIRSPIF